MLIYVDDIYNVLGNRVSREVNQTTTFEMFYDGADCVGDDDGSTQRCFITPGLDENVLINNGSDYYYTQDGLGSVRELVDTNQATQNTYDYEAFGAFYGDPSEDVTNNWFTYTGREWDSESSTYYYRARQYNQHVGRFLQRDPILASNLYCYTGNRAVLFTDSFGRDCCCKSVKIEMKGNRWNAFLAELGGGTELGWKTDWHNTAEGNRAFAVLRFMVTVKVEGDIKECKFGQFKQLVWQWEAGKEKKYVEEDIYNPSKDNPVRDHINPNPGDKTTRQWADTPGFRAELEAKDSIAGHKMNLWAACLDKDEKNGILAGFTMEYKVKIPGDTSKKPEFVDEEGKESRKLTPEKWPIEETNKITVDKFKEKLYKKCVEDMVKGE